MKKRVLILLAAYFLLIAGGPSPSAQEPPLPQGLSAPSDKLDASDTSDRSEASDSSEEPALPEGLGAPKTAEEPAIPEGLGGPSKSEAPSLPEGLGGPEETGEGASAGEEKPFELPFDLAGFWEVRAGVWTQNNDNFHDASIGETRLQLEAGELWTRNALKARADFLYDRVAEDHEIDLEEGTGWFDLRELHYTGAPASFMDVRIGRQVLTWGSGDYIFINDLFPKDWNSFFLGRDDEYLKAPSDAVKVSFFSEPANLDVVYTPRFDADRFIDGTRVSYWDPLAGEIVGRDMPLAVIRPDEWFEDDEIAARVYRNLSGWELALYAYDGFWKSPNGFDRATSQGIFPPLSVYGASARGTVWRGVGNIEFGYYDSKDDRDGDDPFVRNSEMRFLLGYEQEIAPNFTAGFQYYLERMMDYDVYVDSLPVGSPQADENRSVFTVRLTKLLMSQNLSLSLFTFYSPTDRDAYLRPKVHYKIDDHWSVEGGGNVFLGAEDYTFFGQFEDNSNVYAAARYGF